tara:strand:- start:2574 stop:3056 length:483 start_codon:yes stop_codon:yes gene_type:complete
MSPQNEDSCGNREQLLEKYNQLEKFYPCPDTPVYSYYVSTMNFFGCAAFGIISQDGLSPRCNISILYFFLRIYQVMFFSQPLITPRNCSTFGIIQEILNKNIDKLPNSHGVSETSEEDVVYISNRRGWTFARNTETGEEYSVRDFYNHFQRLYPEECNPL